MNIVKAKNKKIKYISIVAVFCVIIYYAATTHFFANYPFAHFYPYHNKGTIELTIDGQQFNIDNIELSFYSDSYFFMPNNSNAMYETCLIKNNKFRLKKGSYGGNVFIFTLPHEDYGILPNNDVVIQFGQFNTNNWHVLQYNIEINIDTTKNGAHITINQADALVTENDSETFETKQSTDITDEQNIASCYVGP